MAKVLLTGNAGFIGMHMALRLAKEGYEVVGIDNINEYYDINLKYARLSEQGIEKEQIEYGTMINGHEGIRFMKLNLEDREIMNQLFKDEKFDYVVHLAAQAGVRYSIENPHAYINSNITGFLNILECCRMYPVRNLLYASSSSVYGLNAAVPFREEDPTEHPVSLYAATKKANEMMAHSYAHVHQIPVTGLRFFTVYGPWGRPDMAPFKFTKNILEGKPIDVYNFGRMQRDFTYVDDIVGGIFSLLDVVPQKQEVLPGIPLKTDESSAPYAIYNIGNSQPVKLLDFVKAIEKSLDKQAVLNLIPLQPGDVTTTYAAMDKLKEKTDYAPSTPLEEGTRKFVEWYLMHYHKELVY